MNKNNGYYWMPYVTKIYKMNINGEPVWYANKWKNLLLKIKHIFVKPKYLKHGEKYIKGINLIK